MQNILIVRVAAIGDVILALPMLPYLKKQYPECKITWLAGKGLKVLLEQFTEIDELILVDEGRLVGSSFFKKAKEYVRVWARLLLRRFSLILNAHTDPSYHLLTKFCMSKTKRNFYRKQSDSFPRKGVFHTYEYLRLVSPLYQKKEGFCFPKINKVEPSPLFGELPKKPFIVISAGGNEPIREGKSLRMWPIEYYSMLIKECIEIEIPIVVVGARSDAWVRKFFKDLEIFDFIGKTSLLDLLAIFQQAACVITHDSGPLHIARLASTKRIGLFGPTNPYEFADPSEEESIFWGGKHLTCRPCYTGTGYPRCQQHHSCMREITPKEVLKEVKKILNFEPNRATHKQNVIRKQPCQDLLIRNEWSKSIPIGKQQIT